MAEFFIKYGEKEHLQQIVDGKLRFTPSQTYIKIEEKQHNKGQGDLLEGRMKIKIEGARMYHPETNEYLGTLPKSTVVISIQAVSNMPIFCLSYYGEESIVDVEGLTTIDIDAEHIDGVKKDFLKATHALILFEPEKFISSVEKIEGKHFVSGEIKYYDYDMNPIQMYMFLTMGTEEIQTDKYLSMTYDNRYRHLLCKDVAFENQREYRFIGLDDLISNPVFYNFKYNGKYLIVPIDDLMTKSIVVQ